MSSRILRYRRRGLDSAVGNIGERGKCVGILFTLPMPILMLWILWISYEVKFMVESSNTFSLSNHSAIHD
jgi:Na+/H+ antiporter NhaC